MKQNTNAENYKIVKQSNKIKKIAYLVSFLWILCVIAPSVFYVNKNSVSLKKYISLKGVGYINNSLVKQYDSISKSLVQHINISKYIKDIKIPEIKLDKIEADTAKVGKTARVLSNFGVRAAGEVADKSDILNKQVAKINADIKTETEKLKRMLETDLEKSIKDEISNFATNQSKQVLKLSKISYYNFVNNKYGIIDDAGKNRTNIIYKELMSNDNFIIKNYLLNINKYFIYINYLMLILVVVVGLVPVYALLKVVKMFTKNFTTCPYCRKIFISKEAKFNILAKLKFWD